MRLLLYGLALVTSSFTIETLNRGVYHDEDKPVSLDYEDDSHNLTDFANRHVNDDDADSEEPLTDDKDDSEDADGDFRNTTPADSSARAEILKKIQMAPATFIDRKSFACPLIKKNLKTGTSIGDLSPEDISIIAAMGDALATGIGLWPQATIEFRGAAFPIGGDATIDGLVTIPNILREFSPRLLGVSHGMGTREQLPDHQLNVAQTNAKVSDLPAQAYELVRRLKKVRDVDYSQVWVMVIVTIGTQEVCSGCSGPDDHSSLEETIDILHMSIPKAIVVLLGPLHVSSPQRYHENILWQRCDCRKEDIDEAGRLWKESFKKLERHLASTSLESPTFGLIALPMLTITSRFPKGLFMPNSPLLNRRGHNYATKFLWNRLLTGKEYNLTSVVLSIDKYACPEVHCPYFRTWANAKECQTLSRSEAKEKELALGSDGKIIKMPRRSRQRLYTIAGIIVALAFFFVIMCGSIFYHRSKAASHGRFEVVDEPTKKLEEAQKEEQKALLSRHNTRAVSDLNLPNVVSRHNTFRGTIDEPPLLEE
ncbi:unnamed protein product [Caenorhabditis auriculariae]|uniref:Lipase_GDSL domain-containing protein n=1 Tax=Caenorhabditis auriculariae TaxID=2777116 RepID=A0A8S1GMQ3_9PELO|nr:unnamed protein product [Caenorhabditis auriculariae]